MPSRPRRAVQVPLVGDLWQQVLHPPGGRRELLPVQPHPVVSPGALHAPAGVIYLAEDHHPGQAAALERVVRRPILHPPQQHVPVGGPHHPKQKLAPWGAESHADVLLGTGTQQRRGSSGVGEGDDALKRVQGAAINLRPVPFGHHVLAVQCEKYVLRQDKHGVQQLSHGFSSLPASSMARLR